MQAEVIKALLGVKVHDAAREHNPGDRRRGRSVCNYVRAELTDQRRGPGQEIGNAASRRWDAAQAGERAEDLQDGKVGVSQQVASARLATLHSARNPMSDVTHIDQVDF